MVEAKCVACGRSYLPIAGHGCGDSETARELRVLLAKEKEKVKLMEDGIGTLDNILLPIAQHFSHQYNKWRSTNPKAISYAKAGEMLVEYMKDR